MSKIVRMCINCRKRFFQKDLLRLQCKEKKIIKYSGIGRSFYICKDCLKDEKLVKNLVKICKVDRESAFNMLKEIIDNG